MAKFRCIIRDEVGLHVRSAGRLVNIAKKFPHNEITISKGSRTADAKRILAVMMLEAQKGDEVEITVTGNGSTLAAQQLAEFCEAAI